MTWRVITYRLPAEPSRHRVAVWRELRECAETLEGFADRVYQAREQAAEEPG